VEKPAVPPSNLANMGVYLFNVQVLDRVLWEDHKRHDSSHDFGKDILPRMIRDGNNVYAYPYSGYWVDVGTVSSYWQAHMDLLGSKPSINLYDRSWVIHTRTEERPPVRFEKGAVTVDSMITDGCLLAPNCLVERSILSAGVRVESGAVIRESIILTDAVVKSGAVVERAIIDKKVTIGENAQVGKLTTDAQPSIAMVGKNSVIPAGYTIEPGAVIGTDVIDGDYPSSTITSGEYITTKREAHEV
jgi:glucose-1-phosphate adenylyltransferase